VKPLCEQYTVHKLVTPEIQPAIDEGIFSRKGLVSKRLEDKNSLGLGLEKNSCLHD